MGFPTSRKSQSFDTFITVRLRASDKRRLEKIHRTHRIPVSELARYLILSSLDQYGSATNTLIEDAAEYFASAPSRRSHRKRNAAA